jgi:hypothetical protein
MSVLEITNAMKNPGSHFGFDDFCEGHGNIDDMILEIDSYMAITTCANDQFWNNLDELSMMKSLLLKSAIGQLVMMLHGRMIPLRAQGVYGSSGGCTGRM